jgi:hypothetical protein
MLVRPSLTFFEIPPTKALNQPAVRDHHLLRVFDPCVAAGAAEQEGARNGVARRAFALIRPPPFFPRGLAASSSTRTWI